MATKEKKILLPDDPPTGTGVQGEVATQSPQTQPAAMTTPLKHRRAQNASDSDLHSVKYHPQLGLTLTARQRQASYPHWQTQPLSKN